MSGRIDVMPFGDDGDTMVAFGHHNLAAFMAEALAVWTDLASAAFSHVLSAVEEA